MCDLEERAACVGERCGGGRRFVALALVAARDGCSLLSCDTGCACGDEGYMGECSDG